MLFSLLAFLSWRIAWGANYGAVLNSTSMNLSRQLNTKSFLNPSKLASLTDDLILSISKFANESDTFKLLWTSKSLRRAIMPQSHGYLLNNKRLTVADLVRIPAIYLRKESLILEPKTLFSIYPSISIAVGSPIKAVTPFIIMRLQPVNDVRWYHLFLPLLLQCKYRSNSDYFVTALLPSKRNHMTSMMVLKENMNGDINRPFGIVSGNASLTWLNFIQDIIKYNVAEVDDSKWILADKQTMFHIVMFNRYMLILIDIVRLFLLQYISGKLM